MTVTSDDLVAGVKSRVIIPASQVLFTDTNIMDFCNKIISGQIVAMIESTNQEFFVYTTDLEIVGGKTEYSIPHRAIGRALRETKLIDGNNNVRNMPLINLEDAQLFSPAGQTVGFYFRSDKVHLVPDVPENSNPDLIMRFWWRLPPSKLVPVSAAAQVLSVTGSDVTVSSVPDTIVTGSVIDFIQGESGNSILGLDVTVTAVNANQISFAADTVPEDLQAGDYIALAGYSPVINFIPDQAHSLIESMVAYRIMTSLGDFEGAKMLDNDISAEKKAFLQLIEPRIDGEPTIIVNRYGLARYGRFMQRSWLYGN